MASKGKQLKALIQAPEILVMPGVYDGYSVRLAERSGFKAASISGSGVSESRLSTAALKGMMNAMAVFREEVVQHNRVVDRPDLLASFDELNELMGERQVDDLERRFVGG